MMERALWLKQMQEKTEALYDHFSPLYWVNFGLHQSETHQAFLQKFLERLPPGSRLLSAGCGAGLHDGMLLEAGHSLVGIDLSEGMLARAREQFPQAQYLKMGLQEMDFRNEFEGATCIDALEHIFPEDWPVIVRGFREALKPGGWLYFTVDVSAAEHLEEAYERGRSQGLPVVFGEVAADVDAAFDKLMAFKAGEVPDGDLADSGVYHYYPPLEQVRGWLGQEMFVIEAEAAGRWYRHFLARRMGDG